MAFERQTKRPTISQSKASLGAQLSSSSIGQEVYTIEQLFVMYSKFGDPKSDGKRIALSQSDKWMKQAKIIDGRHITTTLTGVTFNKFKRRTISYKQYLIFLHELVDIKGLVFEELVNSLCDAGPPSVPKAEKKRGSLTKIAPEEEKANETK